MQYALDQAEAAIILGEVPVGALLVYDNQIIATAHNRCMCDYDPTAHAEMLVIRAGAKTLQDCRLVDCDLYVTLEPCAMCAQAAAHARIRRIIFGAYDPKGGGVDHGARIFDQPTCHHRPEIIGGIMEQACRSLLQTFFQNQRKSHRYIANDFE